MIELSHQEVIDLTVNEFDSYVRNQWGWRGSFLSSSSAFHFSGAAITTGNAF